MVMVIAIIAIMCAVAIPFFGGFIENRDLKTAAGVVASDFYQTKQNAIASNSLWTITFNVAGNSYTIAQLDSNGIPVSQSTNSPGSIKSTILIDPASPPNFMGTPLVVTFSPRGTVNSGSLQLVNSRTSTATVTISITGRTYVNYTALK